LQAAAKLVSGPLGARAQLSAAFSGPPPAVPWAVHGRHVRLRFRAPLLPRAAAGRQRTCGATPRGRRHGAAGRGARVASPPPTAACFGARCAAVGGSRAPCPRTPFRAEAAACTYRHARRPQRGRRGRRVWRRSPGTLRAAGAHRPRPPGRLRGGGQRWGRCWRQGPGGQRCAAEGRRFWRARRWQRQRCGQQGTSRRLDVPKLRGAPMFRQNVEVLPLQGASPCGRPRRRSGRSGTLRIQRNVPRASRRQRGSAPIGEMGPGGGGGQLPILPRTWGERRS
jgi:hypothetical protein